MKYLFSIMLVFLLVPAFAIAEVTVVSDAGPNVNLLLDQSAQDTYARAKAEFGDDIMKRVVGDWVDYQAERYARNDDVMVLKQRLDSLDQTDKQKVSDLITACKLGSC